MVPDSKSCLLSESAPFFIYPARPLDKKAGLRVRQPGCPEGPVVFRPRLAAGLAFSLV